MVRVVKFTFLILLTVLLLFMLYYIVDSSVWKILDLLIIPFALATGIWWLNKNDRIRAEIIERKKQQAFIIEEYYDRITALLLDKNLRESKPGDDIHGIARARTITTLSRLGKEFKPQVLLFLHESNLLGKESPFISLNQIDLSGIDLSGAFLANVRLYGCNLSDSSFESAYLGLAQLENANLQRANMKGAILNGSNLNRCNLDEANLENVSFCDDISKYSPPASQYVQEKPTSLANASLKKANLKNAFMVKTNFGGADLTGANLTNADLRGAHFYRTTILKDVIIENTNFESAHFYDIDLRELTFDISLLSQAKSFNGCILPSGIKFKGHSYEELMDQIENDLM